MYFFVLQNRLHGGFHNDSQRKVDQAYPLHGVLNRHSQRQSTASGEGGPE